MSEKFVREVAAQTRQIGVLSGSLRLLTQTGEHPMPHFPKPFFRRNRGLWYVQLHGKQINLGPDKDEAFRQYHLLLSQPEVATVSPSGGRSVAVLCDHFLEWTQRNRSAATYEWYRLSAPAIRRDLPDAQHR